jgi:hypothetical protein
MKHTALRVGLQPAWVLRHGLPPLPPVSPRYSRKRSAQPPLAASRPCPATRTGHQISFEKDFLWGAEASRIRICPEVAFR